MIKVIWFEVTEPSRYKRDGRVVVGGWQDSLEEIVRSCQDIELLIAFETSNPEAKVKAIDGITYIPIYISYNLVERLRLHWSWIDYERNLVPACIRIVEKYSPDLIHVFGNEWPFGLVAQYTNIPVVIHIQGAIVPYNDASYPPGYNGYTLYKSRRWNIIKGIKQYNARQKWLSRMRMEYRIWRAVDNYMGRTEWDRSVANVLHPGNHYYHVEEALRSSFIDGNKSWTYSQRRMLRLITIGCSSYQKGMDMLLKTAYCLKRMGIEFEWKVAGCMSKEMLNVIEYTEGITFRDNNVEILGYTQPDELSDLLCSASLYVHTAYIENSPNSVCESQCLGVPLVSTYVGGIATLVRNGIDGVLVPANDPYQMANTIVELAADKDKLEMMSANTMSFARKRHNKLNILNQLLACYKSILKIE
jgi:glycosyltransferase involved in cell wall biosynthesis